MRFTNCFRKEHIASVLNRLPPRKQFFAGHCFTSCFHDPESASEVSAECEFPAHLSFWKALLEKFHCNDIKVAFTLKTTLRLLKLSLVLLPIHPCHPSTSVFEKRLESANYYALKALLNFGNSLDYDSILTAVNIQVTET